MVDKDTLRTISGFCGLPPLDTLPPELVEIIRQYSRHSLLWRCVPALQLAAHVSATKPGPLLTVPLRDLDSWERGGKFERLAEGTRSPLPILRITLDWAGISKLERLPKLPTYAGEYTNRFAFIVQDKASIPHVAAQLKDGRLRLNLPTDSRILPFWNTLAPPSLSLCKAYPARSTSCPILHAVEMDEISGITFFFASGQVYGIHIHRSKDSCAMDTFARSLTDRLQEHVVWIYLPISRRDRILVLGARKILQDPGMNHMGWTQLNVLVRTALVGDVFVGSRPNRQVRDLCFAASPPVTLVYGEPREGRPVSFFGARCAGPHVNQTLPPPFRLDNRGPCPMDEKCNDAYLSWAPLRDVSSTLVFYDQDTGFCRGIVFRYHNGGAGAIGQCRLQVDPAERVVQPVWLCYRTIQSVRGQNPYERIIQNVHVKFWQGARMNQTEKDSEGWESRPMTGLVKFWFAPKSSVLLFEN
ncbi:hypothetical protein GE09DRAFT_623594 [Coniochaeta sp. 2T2.1]|nr:hypothetical protein GE09DRAFT_623594 [Coniochaeta sp. 2T2.1]